MALHQLTTAPLFHVAWGCLPQANRPGFVELPPELLVKQAKAEAKDKQGEEAKAKKKAAKAEAAEKERKAMMRGNMLGFASLTPPLASAAEQMREGLAASSVNLTTDVCGVADQALGYGQFQTHPPLLQGHTQSSQEGVSVPVQNFGAGTSLCQKCGSRSLAPTATPA
eukprot:352945-Chlamydomonas_euryale.AAC.5